MHTQGHTHPVSTHIHQHVREHNTLTVLVHGTGVQLKTLQNLIEALNALESRSPTLLNKNGNTCPTGMRPLP